MDVALSTVQSNMTTLHHVLTIHPDDIPKFAALGVGANMTPVLLVDVKSRLIVWSLVKEFRVVAVPSFEAFDGG